MLSADASTAAQASSASATGAPSQIARSSARVTEPGRSDDHRPTIGRSSPCSRAQSIAIS